MTTHNKSRLVLAGLLSLSSLSAMAQMDADLEVTEVMMDAHYSGVGFLYTLMGYDPSAPTISFNTQIDPTAKTYSMTTQAGQSFFGHNLIIQCDGRWVAGNNRWESSLTGMLGDYSWGANGFGGYGAQEANGDYNGLFEWHGTTGDDIVWATYKYDTMRTIAGVDHSYHTVFELGKITSTTTDTFYDLRNPNGTWAVFGAIVKPDDRGYATLNIQGNTAAGVSSIQMTPVPEPSSICAIAIGAIAVLRRSRKSKK